MRSLGIARLHYLSNMRSASAVLGVSLVLGALPVIAAGVPFRSWTAHWRVAADVLELQARAATVTYVFHLVVLLIACDLFGKPRALRDGKRAADLTETAPVRPAHRFIGDAAGIFLCAAAIHVCTLPLLALAVALSPLPSSLFLVAETVVLLALVLGSAGAAWKLRSTGRWMRTRTARSVALFGVLLIGAVMFTTRWEAFRDAAFSSVFSPSPRHWAEAAAAMNSPALIVALAALYIGYLVFYFVSSIRDEERLHAL